MLEIKFKYRDEYNYPNWSEQQCIVKSVKECIDFYGLNECEYKILSVIDLDEVAKVGDAIIEMLKNKGE